MEAQLAAEATQTNAAQGSTDLGLGGGARPSVVKVVVGGGHGRSRTQNCKSWMKISKICSLSSAAELMSYLTNHRSLLTSWV